MPVCDRVEDVALYDILKVSVRNSFGVPAHRYLLECRLTNARDLLQGKRHSIAEIAAMTGFSDQSHLTQLFKHQFD
jgi:AraC family transcriptional regulator